MSDDRAMEGIAPLGQALLALGETASARRRSPTRTSGFGTGRRESHDAAAFYAAFDPPPISGCEEVGVCEVDGLFCGDARDMAAVADDSVALVVTSPPYRAAKAYEVDGSAGPVPATYHDYLAMLEDAFAECRRVLEPGGRICVNVANLGRRPYRPLAAHLWAILERLGFLGRGEIVWVKGHGASGSAAFGSFAKASNPVLRDVTERILVASKGRFDRALSPAVRRTRGLPWESTITKADFLAWTIDRWEIPPESARRVGHPAPFSVELPRRLIELYTYRGDIVLDCFAGSGTTAVAAVTTGRRHLGFDTDPGYIELARRRVAHAAAAINGRFDLDC